MKDSRWTMLAAKTAVLSVLGLSALPLLCVIVQYLDATTGFSGGGGYFSDYMAYLSTAPVLTIALALCALLILSAVYLVRCWREGK